MPGQGNQLSETCVKDIRHRVSRVRRARSHILDDTMQLLVVHVAARENNLCTPPTDCQRGCASIGRRSFSPITAQTDDKMQSARPGELHKGDWV